MLNRKDYPTLTDDQFHMLQNQVDREMLTFRRAFLQNVNAKNVMAAYNFEKLVKGCDQNQGRGWIVAAVNTDSDPEVVSDWFRKATPELREMVWRKHHTPLDAIDGTYCAIPTLVSGRTVIADMSACPYIEGHCDAGVSPLREMRESDVEDWT